MALNVPMQAVQQPIVQSLSEAVAKWTDINNAQQQGKLAGQKMDILKSQTERENKLGDLQFGEHQRKAHNDVMTEFKTVLQKKAQAAGIQPNTPEYQQLANATYATGFDKIMQNTGAPPYKMGTNIDLSAVDALVTPAEAHAQEMEIETAKQDAILRNQMQLGKFNNEYKDKADTRDYEQSVGLEKIRHNYDVEDAKTKRGWEETDYALKLESGGDMDMTPDAIAANAVALSKNEPIPKNLGKRNSVAIQNAYADLIGGRLPPEQVEKMQQAYLDRVKGQGTKNSIIKQTVQGDLVGGTEKNFLANVKSFDDIASKWKSSDVPFIKAWVQKGELQTGIEPVLAEARVYLKDIINEYAKLVSGSPTGGTATTLAEIEHASDLLKTNFTYDQMQAAIRGMRGSAENRRSTLEAQRKETEGRMSSPKQEQSKITTSKPANVPQEKWDAYLRFLQSTNEGV